MTDNKYMADRQKQKKRNTGLAFAIFILGLLLVFIFFLVKRNEILTNLKETNFFDRVFGKTPEFVQNHISETEMSDDDLLVKTNDNEIIIQIETEKKPSESVENNKIEPSKVPPVEVTASEKKEETEVKEETAPVKKEEPAVVEKETVTTTVKYTDLSLCFVEVTSDGSIVRKVIKRGVPKNDSPLTTAINLLLDGPDASKSAEKTCMSLIPSGTKLLTARVKDGVAYLNFNDALEINNEGVDGYISSLMQIVYTSTSFSTVKSVQFLIDGEKKEYLGESAQWIGTPLSRASF